MGEYTHTHTHTHTHSCKISEIDIISLKMDYLEVVFMKFPNT